MSRKELEPAFLSPPFALELDRERQAARNLSDEELIAALRAAPFDVAKLIARFAALYEVAHQRGLEEQILMPRDMIRAVKQILGGQLLPALYGACLGNNHLFKAASKLPLSDQARIAANEPIKVFESNGDHRMVPALSLTRQEIKQVFDGDMFADDATQIAKRRYEIEVAAAREHLEHVPNPIRIDKRGKRIFVNGCELHVSQLAQFVAELS